jgi:hypothetical protein
MQDVYKTLNFTLCSNIRVHAAVMLTMFTVFLDWDNQPALTVYFGRQRKRLCTRCGRGFRQQNDKSTFVLGRHNVIQFPVALQITEQFNQAHMDSTASFGFTYLSKLCGRWDGYWNGRVSHIASWNMKTTIHHIPTTHSSNQKPTQGIKYIRIKLIFFSQKMAHLQRYSISKCACLVGNAIRCKPPTIYYMSSLRMVTQRWNMLNSK